MRRADTRGADCGCCCRWKAPLEAGDAASAGRMARAGGVLAATNRERPPMLRCGSIQVSLTDVCLRTADPEAQSLGAAVGLAFLSSYFVLLNVCVWLDFAAAAV